MNLSRRGYVVLFVLLALSSVSALAQSSSGTVSGQVTDQQGASVPGVSIKLTEPSTNITLTTVTNDAGRFIIVNVSPGSYNITFSKVGFSMRKVSKQEVKVVKF
jgi:hypothetical protein